MAAGSAQFHESVADLTPETMDNHRAFMSLMEEFEAVDWYDQRIDATGNASLAAILQHNRDEEKEHASMVLEWLRRRDPVLDEHLRRYLFTEAPIDETAEASEAEPAEGAGATRAAAGANAAAGGGATASPPRSLGLGDLRGKEAL